jgi:hypothetical protein
MVNYEALTFIGIGVAYVGLEVYFTIKRKKMLNDFNRNMSMLTENNLGGARELNTLVNRLEGIIDSAGGGQH